jgi:hypothetical protein
MEKILNLKWLFAAASALMLTGCAGDKDCGICGRSALTRPAAKFSHPREITNPYLPLAALKQDILESKTERVERTVKPGIHKTFAIAGHAVEALAVEDREYDAAGNLTEATLDYFAQDDLGNVFYLGEDVDTYKDGKVSGHSGAWLLGRDTKTPGVLLPANPQAGDAFQSEAVPGITVEDDVVVSRSETLTVPCGTFHDCVKIKERASGGGTEYKYYAPGTGVIAEMDSDGELLLKSHSTN